MSNLSYINPTYFQYSSGEINRQYQMIYDSVVRNNYIETDDEFREQLLQKIKKDIKEQADKEIESRKKEILILERKINKKHHNAIEWLEL